MKDFSRSQLKTLAILQLVTALMVIGMLFLPSVSPIFYFEQSTDVDANVTTSEPHNIYRSAHIATANNLSFENNFGGSLDESVIASFSLSDGILIFATTTSTDYDFEGDANSYALEISKSGSIKNITSYEGFISQVIAIDDGFLLTTNSESGSYAIKTDSFASPISSLLLSTDENVSAIDIYIDYFSNPTLEPYHIVTEYISPYTHYKEITVYIVDVNFTLSYTTVFARSQSVEYISAYSHTGGFYMFANLMGYTGNCMTYYNWTKSNFNDDVRQNLTISAIDSYYCDYIIPTGNDSFAMLVRDENSIAYLVDCYQGFNFYNIVPLGTSVTETTSLFCDNDYIYSYSYCAGDIASVYRFDYEINIIDKISSFNSLSALYCHAITPYGTLLCGKKSDNIIVAGVNDVGVAFEEGFTSLYENISYMHYTDEGIMLVGTTRLSSINSQDNFGGIDIWVSMLTL